MRDWRTNPQELSTYDFIMDKVLEYTQTNVNQQQVEQLMDMIAYHETGPKQRGLPEAIQIIEGGGEGPGRGLFQYELESLGGSGAGRTAMNNLLEVYKGDYDSLPVWAKKYFDINNKWGYANPSGDVDFSELTEEQQKVLFLADKLKDPNVKLGDIGVVSDSTWWAKYHHKGGGDEKKFQSSKSSYLNNSIR
jgi:hypothetical protein